MGWVVKERCEDGRPRETDEGGPPVWVQKEGEGVAWFWECDSAGAGAAGGDNERRSDSGREDEEGADDDDKTEDAGAGGGGGDDSEGGGGGGDDETEASGTERSKPAVPDPNGGETVISVRYDDRKSGLLYDDPSPHPDDGYDDDDDDDGIESSMARVDQDALEMLRQGLVTGSSPSMTQLESLLAGIGPWPQQKRPQITDDAFVSGISLGLNVHPRTGQPQLSKSTRRWPHLAAFVARVTKDTLTRTLLFPNGLPFSSLQINANFKAKKHRDKNNLGPSAIRTLGEHDGGELECFAHYCEPSSRLVDPRRSWCLFEGTRDHQTCHFHGERISIIAYTSSQYHRVEPPDAAMLLQLGFTAIPNVRCVPLQPCNEGTLD